MLPVIDVAIGIVFVFLLFSLVVTALNEVILSKLDLRARFLKPAAPTKKSRGRKSYPAIAPSKKSE
jgi:hypothetical protein